MKDLEAGMQDLRKALAKDMQPIGDALFSALQAGDVAAMSAALKRISSSLSDMPASESALTQEILNRLTDAFLTDTPAP